MKLTINKIYTSDKDKNGVPFKSKEGRPYTKLSFKCNEFGDTWIGGFQNKSNTFWKEGTTLEVGKDIELEDYTGKDGRIYKNFKTISVEKKMEQDIDELKKAVKLLHDRLKVLEEGKEKDDNYPDDDINPEDIPF